MSFMLNRLTDRKKAQREEEEFIRKRMGRFDIPISAARARPLDPVSGALVSAKRHRELAAAQQRLDCMAKQEVMSHSTAGLKQHLKNEAMKEQRRNHNKVARRRHEEQASLEHQVAANTRAARENQTRRNQWANAMLRDERLRRELAESEAASGSGAVRTLLTETGAGTVRTGRPLTTAEIAVKYRASSTVHAKVVDRACYMTNELGAVVNYGDGSVAWGEHLTAGLTTGSRELCECLAAHGPRETNGPSAYSPASEREGVHRAVALGPVCHMSTTDKPLVDPILILPHSGFAPVPILLNR